MGTDLPFVTGIVMLFLSVPALIAAFSGGRSYGASIALSVTGAALILYAVAASPIGYRAEDIPYAVLRVIAGIVR